MVFLFLRELLPGTPWATTIGALCVALQPMFAFMSASVSPDAGLFPVSAAALLRIVRAFRRGFTTRLALVFGAVIAIGLLTKLNFVAIALGSAVALAALAVRDLRVKHWRALISPAIAACVGGLPVAICALETPSRAPRHSVPSRVCHLRRRCSTSSATRGSSSFPASRV